MLYGVYRKVRIMNIDIQSVLGNLGQRLRIISETELKKIETKYMAKQ